MRAMLAITIAVAAASELMPRAAESASKGGAR
jgi:hypothetical protein